MSFTKPVPGISETTLAALLSGAREVRKIIAELRGGSWRGVVRGFARVSSRYMLQPNIRSNVAGFRCVREFAR